MQIDAILSNETGVAVIPTVPLQPGFRDWEGLLISNPINLPPGGSGLADLEVTFGDGSVFLLPAAVLILP